MLTETERSHKRTDDELLNTSSVRNQLLHSFKTSKEYRHAFVEEKVRTSIAAQIKAIREQRDMKQPELAEVMGKSQSWVSRLEDPNQPPPTIPSLLKAAEAFDVDLEIRFGRFSELLDRLNGMTPASFEVPSFDDEFGTLEHEETTVSDALMRMAVGSPPRTQEAPPPATALSGLADGRTATILRGAAA